MHFGRLTQYSAAVGYEDWVQNVRFGRDTMARDAVAYIERKRPALENLSQSLEAKLSLREKTKRSLFDLAKSPLDAEIEALQAELDGKTDELARFLNRFSKTRRLLNQKALTDWFQRSLLVGLLSAAIVVVVCGLCVAARNLSTTKLSGGKMKVATSRGFVVAAPRQAGLITPIESPTLTDAAFHFTFQPKTGPIPDSISSVLERATQDKYRPEARVHPGRLSGDTGLTLAPSKRVRRSHRSYGQSSKAFRTAAACASRSQDRAGGHPCP